MVNIVGSTDDFKRWKPANLRDHLTVTEVARRVGRDKSRIIRLERDGVLPKPIRVPVGEIVGGVRLYSPKEVRAIEKHFKNAKPGRRPKSR